MVNQAHIRVWGGGIASGWALEAVERDRGAQGKPCSTRNRHGGCGRINIELVVNFLAYHIFSSFQPLKDKGERELLQYWPTMG
jgi:hypothetical protein